MTHYSLLNEKDPVCEYLTGWRIVEADGKVDPLSGLINFNSFDGYQRMNNLPEPWGVPHYNMALPLSLSMKLEVYCEGSWKTIDNWTANVNTCSLDGGGDRFPTFEIAHYGCYPAPAPCDCQRVNGGDCQDPPYPCPRVCKGSLYVSPNGAAYKFTGTIDGEWTNLKNWEDFAGASPASELPNANSVIVIDGNLNTIPTGTIASVNTVTVTAAGAVRIPLSTTHAEVNGIIGNGLSEACGHGVLVMAGTEAAEFKGAGYVDLRANVIGNANFNNTSHNDGTVTLDVSRGSAAGGNATFAGNSTNNGTVTLDATFVGTSSNAGIVDGDATFDGVGCANNQGGVVEGNATFTNSAANNQGGIVEGNATFTNRAVNNGMTRGTGTFSGVGTKNVIQGIVEGAATFTNSAINEGTCTANATFESTAANKYLVNGSATFDAATNSGGVGGNAIFIAGSVMTGATGGSASGYVTGNAVFTNSTSTGGTISGNATFFLTGSNGASVGLLATFNNDTINNNALTGFAIFNDRAINNGSINNNENTTTFNGNSSNRGTITTNTAIFNDSSYNACLLGSVIGIATYNGLRGYVSPDYYVLGQCTTLNSEGNGYWNSQYYYLGHVFDPTLHIFTGTIDGDWNNLGNWKPDANLPLLAERLPLSTENVELWASVTNNGGSQPTVKNLAFNGVNLTIAISLTVTDTATFGSSHSNTGTITGNATFDNTSSNGGTVSGNVTWAATAFLNFSTGTVSGTKTFSSATSVVFTTNGSNNWTYDSSLWNFTTTGPTWIFEGSSSNTGTLAGNATFNGSSNQSGTVTGTTTCNTDGICP